MTAAAAEAGDVDAKATIHRRVIIVRREQLLGVARRRSGVSNRDLVFVII